MIVVIYGSRPDGHARVVFEMLLRESEHEVLGLIDDVPANTDRGFAGLRVIGDRTALPGLAAQGVAAVVLGFGSAIGRVAVLDAIRASGLSPMTLIHPTAVLAPSARIGDGVTALTGAVIGPGARLGAGALVNTRAVIEHDVELGDCAVVSPGAVLSGRVRVGAQALLGSGAVVLPDVRIGDRAVVGAGAVVTRDVPDGAVVVGVPARAQR